MQLIIVLGDDCNKVVIFYIDQLNFLTIYISIRSNIKCAFWKTETSAIFGITLQ